MSSFTATPPAQSVSAPFNMAIATLLDLRKILERASQYLIDPTIPKHIKQQIKSDSYRQFFVNASPLLPDGVVASLLPRFRKLSPQEITMGLMKAGVVKKNEVRIIFNPELEIELDLFLIEVMREMQKEKYFMPPKNDPRYGWKYE